MSSTDNSVRSPLPHSPSATIAIGESYGFPEFYLPRERGSHCRVYLSKFLGCNWDLGENLYKNMTLWIPYSQSHMYNLEGRMVQPWKQTLS
jgi:hypothetical protein